MGVHDKNAHRDLKRALGWPKGAPALRWILVDERTDRHHPVICPLDFVEKFKEEDPKKFQERFVGPAGDIKEYWTGLGDHAIRPELGDKVDPESTGAVGIHADGATYDFRFMFYWWIGGPETCAHTTLPHSRLILYVSLCLVTGRPKAF